MENLKKPLTKSTLVIINKLGDLKIVIKVKYWRLGLFDKTVNTFETNLAPLKKEEKIKKNFKYEDHKFYVTIWLDIPMNEEKKNLEEVKLIDIAYLAPPFKTASTGESGGHSDAGQSKKSPEGGKQPTTSKGESLNFKWVLQIYIILFTLIFLN